MKIYLYDKIMRSLHVKNLDHPENPLIKIIGQEHFDFIIKEKFKPSKNDSYCFREYFSDSYDWQEECYKISFYTKWVIIVYIFTNGIGVDIDYDCGGNSNNTFFQFSNKLDFEAAYDSMVTFVNDYL